MDIFGILQEITIYSGVIFIATMLLKRYFKDRMSPLLHYAVWALLIVRLLLPVTFASPVHLFTVPAAAQTIDAAGQPPQVEDTASNVGGVNTADAELQEHQEGYQGNSVKASGTDGTAVAVKPSVIPISQILTIIWLAGAGVCSSYLILLYCVLRRRVSRNATVPSERLLRLFEKVKTDMGVKTDIKLYCQYEYGTPALMFPRTILMPIGALVTMSDYEAEFALRHELTHYKRGDHIVSILLAVLNAVYWFNPIVWIAFCRIHADMEIACDGAVVMHMEPARRRDYASLIVKLFSQPVHKHLALGMAQGSAKKIAENRVRGIFMKHNSGKGAKLVSLLLAAVLLVTCFTTACQPTPEGPAVIGKDGEAPANAAPYKKSDFPDVYRDSYSKNGADIIFDAAVELPAADKLPTYEITPAAFSQAEVDSIIKGLFGDRQMYAPAKTTKSELQPAYIKALADLREKETHPDQYENSLEYYQGEVNELKEQIDNAPETDTLEPVDGRLKSTQPGTSVFSGRCDLGRDEMATLMIVNHTDNPYSGDNSLLLFSNGDQYMDMSYYYSDIADSGANIKTAKEEAISKANEAVSALGAHDMEYAGCATGIKESRNGQYPAEFNAQVPQAYLVYYTRTTDGVPVTYDLRGSSSDDVEEAYSIPTMYERITVAVDDGGVAHIRWQGPVKVGRAIVESNGVIPFEDVMLIAKDQLSYLYAVYEDQLPPVEQAQAQPSSPIDNGSIVKIEVYIERIELGLMQLPVKDGMSVLAPVWDFFGYYSKVYQSGAEETHYAGSESLLTLSAVNGSIVDRDKGY